jgi:hypothetical protein
MNPQDRMRHRVDTGAVAPAEGERLLAAISKPNERSFVVVSFISMLIVSEIVIKAILARVV